MVLLFITIRSTTKPEIFPQNYPYKILQQALACPAFDLTGYLMVIEFSKELAKERPNERAIGNEKEYELGYTTVQRPLTALTVTPNVKTPVQRIGNELCL